jgi:hypothetical protein
MKSAKSARWKRVVVVRAQAAACFDHLTTKLIASGRSAQVVPDW